MSYFGIGLFNVRTIGFISNPLCLSALAETGVTGPSLLDIGSPKLASLWIAGQRNFSQVLATDISDYFVQDLDQIGRALFLNRLNSTVADAAQLPYPNNSISAVLSVSVIEHIAGSGDMSAMSEIARTLCPGGVAVVSVPYWKCGLEESTTSGELYWEAHTEINQGRVFYQRRYSMDDISSRLVEPSRLAVEHCYLIGEKPATPNWGTIQGGQLVENWKFLLDTRMSRICTKLSTHFKRLPQVLHKYYSKRFHYFCGNVDDPCALAAVLVLRKRN